MQVGRAPGFAWVALALTAGVLVVAAATVDAQSRPPNPSFPPGSYWKENGVSAVENTGDLRLGVDWKGNFGVPESETFPLVCATTCSVGPEPRGADFPASDGSLATGLRYQPLDANVDVLHPARSGGWGLSYIKGDDGTRWHGCLMDESVDCDGRPANVAQIYTQYTDFRSLPKATPDDPTRSVSAIAGGNSFGANAPVIGCGLGCGARGSFKLTAEPVDLAALGPGPVLSVNTQEPWLFKVTESFFFQAGPPALFDAPYYRRALLPAIPTEGSVYSDPAVGTETWDAGTRVSMGMRLPDEAPPSLRFSSTNGYAIPDPTEPFDAAWDPPACPVRLGPGALSDGTTLSPPPDRCLEGMMLELDLNQLPAKTALSSSGSGRFDVFTGGAGNWRWLTWYVGVVPDPAQVQPTLDRINAEVWFLAEGEPRGGEPPLTFLWAYANLYPNQPPEPVVAYDVPTPAYAPPAWTTLTPCLGDSVTFGAETTQLYPANLISNEWHMDGVSQGVNDPRANLTWTFTTTGIHNIRLTETNDKGLSASVDLAVTVLDCTPPALPPTAVLRMDPIAIQDCVSTIVTFRGLNEALQGRPSQSFMSWTLDFGDGTIDGPNAWPPPAAVTHEYVAAGSRTATITVRDDAGMLDGEAVTFSLCANRAPVLLAQDLVPVVAGRKAQVWISANDFDLGAQVTLRALSMPGGAVFPTTTFGANAGQWLTWQTAPYQGGDAVVKVEACDDQGACVQHDITIRITGIPTPTTDADHDGVADTIDNCPVLANSGQLDGDGNGQGDSCQSRPVTPVTSPDGAPASDVDHDGVQDASDNCVEVPNALQADFDADGVGDVCDLDLDGDGVPEAGQQADNCPTLPNPRQTDINDDGRGDECLAPLAATSTVASGSKAIRLPRTHETSPVTAFGAGAFAALLLVLVAWLGRRPYTWVLAFSRLSRAELLKNPARAMLVDYVEGNPGCSLAEAMRALGRSKGAVSHHVRQLEQAGLLTTVASARSLRLYPVGRPNSGEVARSETARRILQAALTSPGATIADLSRATHVQHGLASYHVRRLAEAGLLRLEADGTARRAYPNTQ